MPCKQRKKAKIEAKRAEKKNNAGADTKEEQSTADEDGSSDDEAEEDQNPATAPPPAKRAKLFDVFSGGAVTSAVADSAVESNFDSLVRDNVIPQSSQQSNNKKSAVASGAADGNGKKGQQRGSFSVPETFRNEVDHAASKLETLLI